MHSGSLKYYATKITYSILERNWSITKYHSNNSIIHITILTWFTPNFFFLFKQKRIRTKSYLYPLPRLTLIMPQLIRFYSRYYDEMEYRLQIRKYYANSEEAKYRIFLTQKNFALKNSNACKRNSKYRRQLQRSIISA